MTAEIRIQHLNPGDPFRYEAGGAWFYGHIVFSNASRVRVVMYDQQHEVTIADRRDKKTGRVVAPGRTFMTSGDVEQNLPLDMTVESLAERAPVTGNPPAPKPATKAVSLRPKEAVMPTDPKAAGLIARYNHQQKQLKLAEQTGDAGKQEVARTRITQLEEEAAKSGIELPAYDSEPATGAAKSDPDAEPSDRPNIAAAGKKGAAMAGQEKDKVAAAKAKAAQAKSNGVAKGKAAVKPAKAEKKAKSTHNCLCGCGGETGGLYAPGHDARVKGILLKIERGEMGKDDVPELVVPFVKWAGKHGTEGFKLTACPVKVPGRPEIDNTTEKALEALDV